MCDSLFEVDAELKNSLEEDYPGLRVKGRNADGSIFCYYTPIDHARCFKCGNAYIQKNGYNQPKKIKDLLDGTPIVLSVAFQRYKCPNCCSVLPLRRTSLSYSFSGTSKRLEEYIVNNYSFLGSEYILSSFDSPGFISEAEIRKIFERYTSNYIDQYHEDLEAPKALGLHLISSGKRNYYVLSDLVQERLIDIFPQDEKLALNLFLKQLPRKEQTIFAVTDIDLDCLDAINRQFRNAFLPLLSYSIYLLYSTCKDLSKSVAIRKLFAIPFHGFSHCPNQKRGCAPIPRCFCMSYYFLLLLGKNTKSDFFVFLLILFCCSELIIGSFLCHIASPFVNENCKRIYMCALHA